MTSSQPASNDAPSGANEPPSTVPVASSTAPAEADHRSARPRGPKVLRFLILAIQKARADDLTRQSAALAFITMVSLIPLLAVASFFGARTFLETDSGTVVESEAQEQAIIEDGSRRLAQEEFIQILSGILPYSEEAILDQLRTFLDHASTIGSFGFVMFILTSLSAFTTVETTVNHIWNVPGRRAFRSRLLSFTLVLFWGPLLIGAAYSVLFYLRHNLPFELLNYKSVIELVPSIMTVVGLTMLYWLVPATRVRFRSALIGGIFAALLLEVLRRGFGLYTAKVPTVSLIYGSFGLAFLFMIATHLAWWIVLVGNEVTYALQNFKLLTERRLPAAPFEGSWLGLAALSVITERFRGGQPITPRELLAERLRIQADALAHVIQPLLERGLLRETEGDDEGYLLSRDPHDIRVAAVFDLYHGLHHSILKTLTGTLGPELEKWHQKLGGRQRQQLGKLTLAELVRAPEEAASTRKDG